MKIITLSFEFLMIFQLFWLNDAKALMKMKKQATMSKLIN